MKKDIHKFTESLQAAEKILEDFTRVGVPLFDPALVYVPPENLNLTLFENLPDLFELEIQQKPLVRVVQHLSCAGGTLISRCLAGLPNVAMLSEVNPASKERSRKDAIFSPTDLTALAHYGKFPEIEELSEKIFLASIMVMLQHTERLGKYLLIRDHSHTDYLSDGDGPVVEQSTVKRLLSKDCRVISILTVRHPVDSYLSLLSNQWIRFKPEIFEEYCRRYVLFLEQNEESSIYKYEDFVSKPAEQVAEMCSVLELAYSEDFIDFLGLYELTGNSGRQSNKISDRPRRNFNKAFSREARGSDSYLKLCKKLNYDPSLSAHT